MNVWNEEAATFAEHWAGLADPARHVIADALELRAGTRVLDVGCGSGDFCALALARGADASGIDAAEAMIEIARRRAPEADVRIGAMETLPWQDGTFDAVTGFNSLQFADDPVAALREWARVLSPGGSVAICVWAPREECEVDVVESALRALAGAPEPAPRFCGRLAAVAEDAGLDVRAHESVSVPLEVPDQERLQLAFLFDARAYGAEETAAREAIVAAAAPFRRRDGSYRFENAFRYMLSSPSRNPTPAGT
jgi:SAM-dependent methyltransferase